MVGALGSPQDVQQLGMELSEVQHDPDAEPWEATVALRARELSPDVVDLSAMAEGSQVFAESKNSSEIAELLTSPDGSEEALAAAKPEPSELEVNAEVLVEDPVAASATEPESVAPDDPEDDAADWRPLTLAVGPETCAEFSWIAATGSVQTYEHRVTFRFVHIDGETGEFLDQQRNVITREAAMRYARPGPAEPATTAKPEGQQPDATGESEHAPGEGSSSAAGPADDADDLAVGSFMRREDRLSRSWSGARSGTAPAAAEQTDQLSPGPVARADLSRKLLRMVSGVRGRLRPTQGEPDDEATRDPAKTSSGGEDRAAITGIARFTRGNVTGGTE